MKDVFNKRQRFSLRKYSVGVCSVLLGTALFAAGAQSASADEAKAASESAGTVAPEAVQPATTESSQTEAPAASPVYGEGAPALKVDLSNSVSTSEAPASATEKSEVAEKVAATENKEAKAEPKKEEKAETKKSEEAPKTTASSETSKSVEKKKESNSKSASTTAATTTQPTATPAAAGENSEAPAASEAPGETPMALNRTVKPTSLRGTEGSTEDRAVTEDRSAVLDRAATDLTNGGALATSRGRRNRRALTDHNVAPIDVVTTIADKVAADPDMTDPNGASVHSQTIPAGYQAKEGDFYTYGIWNLTKYNERYNTNYYARAYKSFDASTDTTVELIDKNTGNVVETHTVTATSGVQKFTTTGQKSNKELTLQVSYLFEQTYL